MEWKYVVSGAVLAVCFFVVLFRQEDRKAREWAFGAIGLILGYWLR